MYKSYRDHIEVLRTRAARPAFARTVELVAGTSSRTTTPITLFTKIFGAVVLGGIIGIAAWTMNKSPITDMFQQSRSEAVKGGTVATSGQAFSASIKRSAKPWKIQRDDVTKRELYRPVSTARSIASSGSLTEIVGNPSRRSGSDSAVNNTTVLHRIADERVASLPLALRDTRPVMFIAGQNSVKNNENNFSAIVGGAIAQQSSVNTTFRQVSFTDAFLGIGYTFSRNSSIRLLGGEEVFALPSAIPTVSYHDTTFVHDGASYSNVIGELQAEATGTRIYWLGASYRYTIGESSVRPFAEILAAGSTGGFLSHQSLGTEFFVSENADINLLLEGSELRSQSSGWYSKLGLASEIVYRW